MSSITPAYNTNFPALFSTGGSSNFTQQRRKSAQALGQHPPLPNYQRSLAPPKVPSYLKQTMYAALAFDQYKYHQSKQDVRPLPSTSNSYSSNSSVLNRQRTVSNNASQVTDRQWEEIDLRLPSCWNPMDKSKNIEIGKNGLDLTYTGPGKTESHAALVRSNFPMRPQCGVYYFEMTVLAKGNDGFIGIGFCSATNKLERLPGWDPDSWGYHGDDGNSFAGAGTGKSYGPCFTTGDIIGCGVNFADRSAFYTKNGTFLGYAFKDMDLGNKEMYPAVGLRTTGERVTVNFGHEPFKFDIDQYVHDQRLRVISDVTTVEEYQKLFKKHIMEQLILSYLIHHGYSGTAKAVIQNVHHVSGQQLELFNTDEEEDLMSDQPTTEESTEEEDELMEDTLDSNGNQPQKALGKLSEKDMEERQRIRAAIINGKIDEAIDLINTYYPGVLQHEERGKDLQLWLKCGKFIEMMREFCETQKLTSALDSSNNTARDDGSVEQNVPGSSPKVKRSSSIGSHSSTPQPATGKRRLSYAAIAASPSSEIPPQPQPTKSTDSMDVDHFPNMPNSSGSHTDSSSQFLSESHAWAQRRPSISNLLNHSSSSIHAFDKKKDNNSSNNIGKAIVNGADTDNTIEWKEVVQYGQLLNAEYRHDTRPKIRSYLVEVFSLLAYPDPYASPVAHLLNISRRDALATEVNAAILAYQNRPEMPALEQLYIQLLATSRELAIDGDGKAALMNIEAYCAHGVDKKTTTSNNQTASIPTTVTGYF